MFHQDVLSPVVKIKLQTSLSFTNAHISRLSPSHNSDRSRHFGGLEVLIVLMFYEYSAPFASMELQWTEMWGWVFEGCHHYDFLLQKSLDLIWRWNPRTATRFLLVDFLEIDPRCVYILMLVGWWMHILHSERIYPWQLQWGATVWVRGCLSLIFQLPLLSSMSVNYTWQRWALY